MSAQHIETEWHDYAERGAVLARLHAAVEQAGTVPVTRRMQRVRLLARLIRLSR